MGRLLPLVCVTLSWWAHSFVYADTCTKDQVAVSIFSGSPKATGKLPSERLASQATSVFEALKHVPANSKMAIMPELTLTPWPSDNKEDFKDAAMAREFAYEIPPLKTELVDGVLGSLAKIARAKKMFLQVGLLEKDEKSKNVWNTAVVIGPTGVLVAKHRKVNLVKPPYADEAKYITPGEHSTTTFDATAIGLGKVGVAICADIYDEGGPPHLMEKYRAADIDLMSVSADWLTKSDDAPETKGWAPGNFFAELSEYLNFDGALTPEDRYKNPKSLARAKRVPRQDRYVRLAVSNSTETAPTSGIFSPAEPKMPVTDNTEDTWLAACLPRTTATMSTQVAPPKEHLKK